MNESARKKPMRRLLAVLLSLCMCLPLLPAGVWAQDEPAAEERTVPATIITKDGEIPVDEDWDETYPYGTFAFGTHQADVAEPGAKTSDGQEIPQTILIPVYRLGGTAGRVTAKITYAPAVTTEPDGTGYVFDYAASGKQDLLIEYENPTPVAAYQELGVPGEEREMTASDLTVVCPDVTEDTGEDDEVTLAVSEEVFATSYRWQTVRNGEWYDIDDATDSFLTVRWGDLWDFENSVPTGADFRCILNIDGALSCTESLLGEVYEPVAEPETMPEDIKEEADAEYTALSFSENFDLMQFDVTFAEGEAVKYIRVTALDDSEAELPELGLFTIDACEGGELSDVCNTLTLMVSDNDEGEPSEVGFEVSEISVDREAGVAKVRIVRTGGKSYTVTAHYSTVDGTAKAGEDYTRKEGD
ncbi:MAG: hypothetical protein II680_02095, partial [Clostridia bacterium]|nr:hypothetical protein [Clostridia bacterium]